MTNNIRYARDDFGIRQVDLAKKLGVTQATLSNWERGEYEPDNESLKLLSEILGVSIDYLLTGEETKHKNPSAEAEGLQMTGGVIRTVAEIMGRLSKENQKKVLEQAILLSQVQELQHK